MFSRRAYKISTSDAGAGAQAVTAPGAFAYKPHENINFGANICLEYVTFWPRGVALRICLTIKDPSLPSESEITLPKMLATGVRTCELEITNGSERVKVSTPLLHIQKYRASDIHSTSAPKVETWSRNMDEPLKRCFTISGVWLAFNPQVLFSCKKLPLLITNVFYLPEA